jgi:hypothetical protein
MDLTIERSLVAGGTASPVMGRLGIRSRLWQRCAAFAALVVLAAAIGFLAPGRAHATDCSAVSKQVEGNDNENWFFLGYRATILVNDFPDYQCHTARSIFLLANSNNWVEFGWGEINGPPHTVYWNRKSDSELHGQFTGHTPSGGTNQQFKIVNENGDHNWSLIYNGNPIGDSPVYVAGNNMDHAINNSEKHGASDDLYAHFDSQQICLTINNCNFGNPGSFNKYANTTDGGYVWCKDSDSEQHVRQNNCS